jgi:hypothetical protein
MNDVCDRCGYAVMKNAAGDWVHVSVADAAMCQILAWADQGR